MVTLSARPFIRLSARGTRCRCVIHPKGTRSAPKEAGERTMQVRPFGIPTPVNPLQHSYRWLVHACHGVESQLTTHIVGLCHVQEMGTRNGAAFGTAALPGRFPYAAVLAGDGIIIP